MPYRVPYLTSDRAYEPQMFKPNVEEDVPPAYEEIFGKNNS